MKKQTFFSMRINGLSVIMMLILLCLTVFGVLSLASASAELRLSQKNADHIAAYSQCDANAQKMLSQVYTTAESANDFAEISTILSGYGGYDTALVDGELHVSFETKQTDALSISVQLSIDFARIITVTSYRLNIETDGAADGLHVWQS